MKIVRTISDLDMDRSLAWALVPTMGAFHEAHLHLMREARKHADCVAVSLFVNPTQFRPGEDFERYPRSEARDFELAESASVDLMFAPSVEEMYPGSELERTIIHVAGVGDRWEGAFRPGHFDGVATVVAKLFNILRPDVALFGLKDFQQCQVIRKMVVDLNFPLRLHFEPTVREADGLALSSRNRYLSQDERRVAPLLFLNLCQLAQSIREDHREKAIDIRLAANRAALSALGFAVDYLELVDSVTLDPVRTAKSWNRLIVAAKLGATRLIDNIGLFDEY